MSHALPRVAHAHHERLVAHVDGLPALGDRILTATEEELRPGLDDLASFLEGTLIPHMDAAEPAIYPELERLLQNRHSTTPMRREHEEIRRLVADYLRVEGQVRDARHTLGRAVALRRIVFQLYALLKIHLAEEEMYIRIVDHAAAADASEMMAATLEHHAVRQG